MGIAAENDGVATLPVKANGKSVLDRRFPYVKMKREDVSGAGQAIMWTAHPAGRKDGSDPMKIVAGVDIGGTKCAVLVGRENNGTLEILEKEQFATGLQMPPDEVMGKVTAILDRYAGYHPEGIGISCGGPLDSRAGTVECPPNLPLWDHVPVCDMLASRYHIPAKLQNDANACALAEWKFGAGQGAENVIFLTFGTGLGAGLILNGRLYAGSSDMAGECGHMRLCEYGPTGYGKEGSFEGFCSGSGIAQLGYTLGLAAFQRGERPAYFDPANPRDVTAKSVADAADQGDETAIQVYALCGEYLGRGLSVLIDILNPDKIILGSIFARSRELLWPSAEKVIEKETLLLSRRCCQVVPALLGEKLGDFAALSVALYA